MRNPFLRLVIPITILFLVAILAVFGYTVLEKWPLYDAVYMVVITLSTVGFREVHQLDSSGKILTIALILSGVGIMAYTVSQIVGIIIEGEIVGYRRRRKMEKRIKEMNDHYIICGYGRVGHEIAMEFEDAKVPYVVIDNKIETATELEGRNIPYIIGNITSDEKLSAAGIHKAKGLLAAADSDTDNVFVTISARVLNPEVHIVARAGHPDLENKLRRAGADRVISPYFIAGKRMASLVLKPVATDFLDIAMDGAHLKFEMRELTVREGSCIADKTLEEAQVRQKSGAHIAAIHKPSGVFNLQPGATSKLETSDVLVAFGAPKQLDVLEGLIG